MFNIVNVQSLIKNLKFKLNFLLIFLFEVNVIDIMLIVISFV